jgi:hypothetical protein
MSYTTDLANSLTAVLEKAVTLSRSDLSGYVANLDFWNTEFIHCLKVIDGYYERFERMKHGIAAFQQSQGVEMRDGGFYPEARMHSVAPIRRGSSNSEIDGSRLRLLQSFERFVNRLTTENLIDDDASCRMMAAVKRQSADNVP